MTAAAEAACPFCPPRQQVYAESPRWRLLRHLDPVPIAGWMMLAAREHRSGLDALTSEESRELGEVLSEIARAVRLETGCERTYLLSFNEAVPHLHLHVVPRHAGDARTKSWALADLYRTTARHEVAAVDPREAEALAVRVGVRASVGLRSLGFGSSALVS